ncbi:helix-turn-helix domain-containing protein [Streptomyces sp. NBRC 110611]|uniref:helix-turn-helix domain-containing protein n=1 Tax=Streptomyces sp. NBRC 110611 TaxID=1621259 RepID=UPI0009A06E78|nr:helix-turn-helix domain-containing protein [Streptomyces sp. NBRC 110611]
MSIDEVAAFLRKPKSWVYGNWRSEGIPFKKVGNQLRCRPAELDDWLDRQIP